MASCKLPKNPLIQSTAAHRAPRGVSPPQCFGVRARALAERQRSSSTAHVDRHSGFPRRPGPLSPARENERQPGLWDAARCEGGRGACSSLGPGVWSWASSLRPRPRGLLDKGQDLEMSGLLRSPLAADLPRSNE